MTQETHKKWKIAARVAGALLFTALMTAAFFRAGVPVGRAPAVKDGSLDLSAWAPGGGLIRLDGRWSFYWDRLLSEPDMGGGEAAPDLLAPVPSVWNSYRLDGRGLPGFGCATYVLHVTGASPGSRLGIWMPGASTAYRLLIDGEPLAGNGTVSARASAGVAQYGPKGIYFTPSSRSFTVALEVSNYQYARGGMWYTPYLGTDKQIEAVSTRICGRDFFLIGCFLLMGFIFLSIFFLRRSEKSSLYFALLCFAAILRTMIFGAFAIGSLLPFNCFTLVVKLDYIIVAVFPALSLGFIRELFKGEIHDRIVRAVAFYGAAVSMVILVTPVSFFTSFVYPLLAVDTALFFYLIACLVGATLHGREDAALTLTGFAVFSIGYGHDMLFQTSLIAGGFYELSPVGFFVLLTLEAFVLSRRFTALIRRHEAALAQLRVTSERERQAELKFLKAQIRPHFLHNSLNTIISVSRSDIERARMLLIEFSNYLRGCFDFSDLNDEIPLENELDFIRSYIALEQARFGDRLKVDYDIADTGVMVPPLILQPLVENAIIHGLRPKRESGSILIYVRRDGGRIRMGVRDNGCGISPERAAEALSGAGAARGVGLYNINSRLNKLYGSSLQIESVEGGGADVSMEFEEKGGERHDPGDPC